MSRFLLQRGVPLDRARKIALGIGAALLPTSLFIVASPLSFALVFFSVSGLWMYVQMWSGRQRGGKSGWFW